MATIPTIPNKVDELKKALRGTLLQPDDDGFEEAILNWNGDRRVRPQFVALVLGARDVKLCLAFCKDQALPMSVFGGGHSLSGMCLCEGFVISLKRLRSVLVDPKEKTVWVGGGCNWADVDNECEEFHLHCPGGAVSETGVAGLTLGGGYDPALSRRVGMAIDSLLEAEVVLADGSIVHASEHNNSELFWCMRGAGSAFGVVTAFKFKLYDIPALCYGGPLIFAIDHMKELMRLAKTLYQVIPDELTIYVVSFNPPPAMQPIAAVCFWWTGDPADNFAGARKYIDQFRALGPLMDECGPVPFPVLHTFFNASFPFGSKCYGRSSGIHYDDFTDEVIDGILEFNSKRLPESFLILEQWGGKAVNRRGGSCPEHKSGITVFTLPKWKDDSDREQNVKWAKDLGVFVRSKAKHPVFTYSNFNDAHDNSTLETMGRDNYDKLKRLKQKYDPTDVFVNTPFRFK